MSADDAEAARATLGRAIVEYLRVTSEDDIYLSDWVVVTHCRTAEWEQEGMSGVGVHVPSTQTFPMTWGLLLAASSHVGAR